MKPLKRRSRETFQSRILIARILLGINMLLWLVSGTIFVYRMVEDQNTWPVALVVFLFLTAVVSLFIVARIIAQAEKWVFAASLFLVGTNLLMTFIGYPDFLFILATIFNFALLANIFALKPYYDSGT